MARRSGSRWDVVDTVEVSVPRDVPVTRIWSRPINCNTAAPPLAWPVTVFCDTTISGLPSVRPVESASRSWRSRLVRVVGPVDVSCLEITAMSSAVTPSLASERARTESLPPRPAPEHAHPRSRDRRVHAVGEARA